MPDLSHLEYRYELIADNVQASTTIYESLLRPLFKQYETPIDLILLLLNSISAIVIHYLIVLPSYRVFGIYDRIRSRISPGVVGDKEYPIEISDDGSQEDVSGIIVTRIISDVSTPKVPGALLRSTRKSARKEMVPKSPIFIKDIPTSILPVASGRHGTPRPQSTAQLGSSSTPLSTFPSSDKTPLYPAIPAFIIPNPTAQPASTIPQPTSNTQPLIPIPSHSRVSQIPNVSKTIPPRIKTRPVKPLDTTSAVSQKRPTTLKVRKDPSLPVSRLDLAPKIKERGPVRAALSLQKDVKRAKVNGKRNVDEMEDDSGKKLDRKGKGVMEGERNVEEIRKALGGKRIKRDVESVIPLERKIVSKVVEDEGAGVGLKGKKRKAEDEPKDINRMMKKVDVGTRLREDEKTVPPRRVMRSRVVREI